MISSTLRRWLVLGGALLATVVASVWPRDGEHPAREVVAPVTRTEVASPRQTKPPAEIALPELGDRLARAPATSNIPDLFGATTWSPPAAGAKPRPEPAAAPAAPPFPYAIIGSAESENGLVVVFSRQNQDFAVKAGDVLEKAYRVDAIDAQSVSVTYLPLGLTQVFAIQRN